MPNRLRAVFLLVLLSSCFANPAFSQPENTENFTIKPGQSVYLVAVKGDCGGAAVSGIVNGQLIIAGGTPPSESKEQRKTLGYTEPLPHVAEIIGQAMSKDKTFVVVNSPDKADFIFHVCAAYTEDLMNPDMLRRMNMRSQLAYSEARMIPASVYRADKEAIFAPTWKAKTPDLQRSVPASNAKPEERKKKEKNTPAPQQQGMVVINGVQMAIGSNTAKCSADFDDLIKYFLQDYPKIAAIKIPKAGMVTATIIEDSQRPALTNKPDDAPLEKSRPALVNKAGEPLTEAKSETTAKPATEPEEVIKVDTALVYVPVRVFDKDGRYVPDLTKKEFKVFEDDSEQEIENFSNVDDPFHVVLLLDMSGSTRFKVEEIQDAALEFIEQLRPQDQVMVASFESSIYVDADFTNDRAKLTKAILRTHTGGGTRLYDAVDLVLTERLNRIQGRKAIVLFSDGIDGTSKVATLMGNLDKVEEANTLVYTVHYDTTPDLSQGMKINEVPIQPHIVAGAKARMKEVTKRATMYLNELAIRSGGRSYEAATMTDAKAAFASIAEELRRQYWLSYYSTNPKSDGSYRKIRVGVNQSDGKKWAVRAKNGYRAPKK